MKKNNLTLEESFAKLDLIVKKLEDESNSIEQVIKLFKEGTDLSKICKDKLNKAELLLSSTIKKNNK